MAGTLRSLAGSAVFKTTDVISALHSPLTPEQIVLDRYVFLPHARTGIAAALSTPFGWGLPARATVGVRVPVIDDRGGLDAEMTVHVHGPADVTEIDPHQVINGSQNVLRSERSTDGAFSLHVGFADDLAGVHPPAGEQRETRLRPMIPAAL